MQLTEKSVVISGRIRLARNYADLPFKHAPHFQHQGKCIARAVQALKDENPERYQLFLMEELSPDERLALVEDHLISKDLLNDVSSGAALIRDDRKISVMVNEEDHLRIQALVDGMDLESAAKEAFETEELLGKDHPFSFDHQLGYLTSCPTNTGTGLRASLMLHLPLLFQFHMMGPVAQNVAKLGLTLRGIYGEGSEAVGNLYQVSNQVTLGRTEQDIIESVTAVGKQLIATENRMRQRYIDKRNRNICNIAMRSYGMMKYAVEMDEQEMLKHWSHLRLGVTLGIIPHTLEQIDHLLSAALDAHVKQYIQQNNLSVDVNEGRCCLIRELLSQQVATPINPFATDDQ